jgi:3-hydroxyacyl-[acyl-carrier protein] dehydratase/trans-2-decenoyl-[acyl-carrier protein] isomerase
MSRVEHFSYHDLISCANGTLINTLNERAIARLPSPNMLMMDRISHISNQGGEYGKGKIIAELAITPELWFFQCHFKDDPVMPGCLGLDALWQLAGFFLSWNGSLGKGRALGSKEVKFFGQILPTAKKVTYHIDVQRIINRGLSMIVADGQVNVDGRTIYSAKKLKVGLFESTHDF